MSTGRQILDGALSGIPASSTSSVPKLQGIRPASPHLPVFFDVVLDVLWEQEEGERVAVLQPGESYLLTLRIASQTQENSRPDYQLRGEEATINLACQDCPEVALLANLEPFADPSSLPASVKLSRSQIEAGVEVDFRLEVPPACPRRRGWLQIRCSGEEARYPEVCRKFRLFVQSSNNPWTEQEAIIWNVDPSSPVPPNTAFLYVQQRQTERLTLSAWNRQHAFGPELEVQMPNLSLALIVPEREPIDEFFGRVHAFSSQRIPRLLSWLHDLLKSHGNNLLLVIVDTSGAEIPWEMIHLGYKTGYLGATAEVVRWAELQEYQRIGLWLKDRTGSGYAIGYLDTGSASSADERAELSLLEAKPLETPIELLGRLKQSVAGVGLLYVGCHGAFVGSKGKAPRYYTLYDATNPKELRLIDLDLELQERLEVLLPVVIVNACHSGRLSPDGEGLPSVFLRKLTDGYIGTLGEVGNTQAGTIGAKILRAFRETGFEGVRPSELLRLLRFEAHQALCRESPESWKNLLFTFMYVYYGNPLVRVFLQRPNLSIAEEAF